MASPLFPMHDNDPELDAVRAWLEAADPSGERVARVLRETYDQLYDGQRTGRYSWGELHKTEKTHMGTLVEINLHRAFGFDDGDQTDYRIAGIQVDCKFSMGQYKWMIPEEALGHLCLVVWANDETSSWSAGLVRITRDKLGGGEKGNRDGKRQLNDRGRASVVPLWDTPATLPENLLLHLPAQTREHILSAKAPSGTRHGQAKVSELFWQVQGRIIDRTTVASVAVQADYMKRVRYDGGARTKLRDRGILILGHQKPHQKIARALGLSVPRLGEFVSVRVTPARADGGLAIEIAGAFWSVAEPSDPGTRAPKLGESNDG